jgi:energy-coupling factor transporter ATP-binding protein EcfA2
MLRVFALKVRALGPIRLEKPVELNIGRTVLYGPNGAGKSSIIRVLAYLLSSDESSRNSIIFEINYVNSYAAIFGQADVELCEGDKCARLISDGIDFKVDEAVWSRRYSAARVVGDCIYSSSPSTTCTDVVHGIDGLRTVLSYGSPSISMIIEKIERFLHDYYIELDIERFYGDYFREFADGKRKWRHITLLPYGIKKAIAIIYALESHDAVFIEGFESAFHLDLMRALLDFVNDTYSGKVIVIETHNGLPLRWGIAKGWYVYYVKRDNIVSLTRLEDLTNIELFKKELEALSL